MKIFNTLVKHEGGIWFKNERRCLFYNKKKMGNMNERHFNMITKVGGFLFFSLGKKKL